MVNAEERIERTSGMHVGSEKCTQIQLEDVKVRGNLKDLSVKDNNIKQEEEEEEDEEEEEGGDVFD